MTVNANGFPPAFPSAAVTLAAAMDMAASRSSFLMSPAAVLVPRMPPLTLESVIRKPSSASTILSPLTFTVMVFEVSPAANTTDPEG